MIVDIIDKHGKNLTKRLTMFLRARKLQLKSSTNKEDIICASIKTPL